MALLLEVLLLFSTVFGLSLGCSCVDGSFDIERSTAICNDFRNSDNIYIGRIHEIFCKCLLAEDNDSGDFSCLQYNLVDGSPSGEAQATYNCEEFSSRIFQQCDTVNSLIAGSSGGSIDPVRNPVINVTDDDGNCGLDTNLEDIYGKSGCVLNFQPCYYTVNVTRVFKGSYTVGSVISSPGPDVLTTCGEENRVLKLGMDYVVGVGGACSPISAWSPTDMYNSSDLDLLARASNNSDVCSSAVVVRPIIAVLMAAVLALLAISFVQ